MFEDIEKIFKREDLLTKISRLKMNIFIFLIVIFAIDFFFYAFIMYLFLFISSNISIKKIFNIKFSINRIKNYINNSKKKLKNKISKRVNIKTKEQYIPIINHYRDYSLKKIIFKFNFNDLLSIISVILTLTFGIYKFEPDTSTMYIKIISTIILLPSLTILLINMIIDDYSIFIGKKDIYKRLEEMFTELYLE